VQADVRKDSAISLALASDTVTRRRLIWLARAVLTLSILGWTALVDQHRDYFSACSFTGGIALIFVLVHALDFPDIVAAVSVSH
jgi:hypothetical protein